MVALSHSLRGATFCRDREEDFMTKKKHTPHKTAKPLRKTVKDFEQLFLDNLVHNHGQAYQTASKHDLYMALAYSVRDHLIDRWRKTHNARYEANPKFTYYLSAEYLLGKQLPQNLLYTDTYEIASKALEKHGIDIQELLSQDVEPGLGNGGLGRLAACFIDSLATMDIPAVGYGIRYEFGIFQQTFEDGWQVEKPDDWACWGNPWEFPQPDDAVEVGLWGHTEHYRDEDDQPRVRWHPYRTILGEPCTTLVPGYGTETVNILRLWRARATANFDFELFNSGDYTRAVAKKVYSENVSKVLYPNDSTPQGKELRLEQQYFFVTCSLRDIINRFRQKNSDWNEFPNKVAIQLNDTHPVIAIPELMRILMDEEKLNWEPAWDITTRTFAYTCHTLLPEALETWPVDMFGHLLPRHLEIVYEINHRFLKQVRMAYPGDDELLSRMSIIGEDGARCVRMANLATIASFAVNGVAELHSHLLKERTLRDFAEMYPDKFQNKTNGVTPRRFVRMANPRLSELITKKIGDGWLRDLDELQKLEKFVKDKKFRKVWRDIKRANKEDLAVLLNEKTGVDVNVDSIFDVQVKRLHEYKRQLLKVLHIIWLYQRIKSHPELHVVPRTFIFGAKAAPGYYMAKRIIKLIHGVAEVVNDDPEIGDKMKVVFPANYNVSMAQVIIPGSDISEQISMAGKEASGTGNMKFALNGAMTVGTLDGANVEIRERVGEDNFFLFGLTTEEVFALKTKGYDPMVYLHGNPELKAVIDAIAHGQFSDGDREVFRPIVDSLLHDDQYLLFADFQSYVDCCEEAAHAYSDQEHWTRMSILNAARCGFFSSDRSMEQYCSEIWGVEPLPLD
jgi:starch phosphorylase